MAEEAMITLMASRVPELVWAQHVVDDVAKIQNSSTAQMARRKWEDKVGRPERDCLSVAIKRDCDVISRGRWLTRLLMVNRMRYNYAPSRLRRAVASVYSFVMSALGSKLSTVQILRKTVKYWLRKDVFSENSHFLGKKYCYYLPSL